MPARSSARPWLLLLRECAIACLRKIRLTPTDTIQATETDDRMEITIRIRPLGQDGEPLAEDRPAQREYPFMPFLLSPMERQAFDLILKAGPVKGSVIGAKLHMIDSNGQASGKLRGLLSGLCEREILTTTDNGYAVADGFRQLWESKGVA